ncbi:MAG: GNAT family N-acetyltransferase [Bacteroidetes bacterium]|nr:GNAT family N-acetyltransferase [Bacteroidota bacterium]
MSGIFLQTERLLFQEFTPSDLNLIFELDSDARVMEFIRPAITEPHQAQPGYNRIMNTRLIDNRFGNWVAVTKNTNEKIGWFCLKYIDNTDLVEVGYRLLHKHWGKGYATEGAKALIDYGFNICNLNEIVGITHPKTCAHNMYWKNADYVLLKNGMFMKLMYFIILLKRITNLKWRRLFLFLQLPLFLLQQFLFYHQ